MNWRFQIFAIIISGPVVDKTTGERWDGYCDDKNDGLKLIETTNNRIAILTLQPGTHGG